MDITKYPQYELYTFTELLFSKKEDFISDCGCRCVYSTIINRCYYSSYLYSLEWLQYYQVKKFFLIFNFNFYFSFFILLIFLYFTYTYVLLF